MSLWHAQSRTQKNVPDFENFETLYENSWDNCGIT